MALVAFDLDDTLYAERDFVRSAFRHISAAMADRYGIDAEECYALMEVAPNAYDALYGHLLARGLRNVPLPKEMVEMYRCHRPVLLPFATGAEQLLTALRRHGHTVALITDGRVGTQQAKIDALRLERFIHASDIMISQATGHDKTAPYNFERIQLLHPEADRFFYVGDNPEKDFEHPRRLGWTTIAVRDTEGRNIHPQNFDGPGRKHPDFIVDSLSEILPIVEN